MKSDDPDLEVDVNLNIDINLGVDHKLHQLLTRSMDLEETRLREDEE